MKTIEFSVSLTEEADAEEVLETIEAQVIEIPGVNVVASSKPHEEEE